MKAVVDSKQTDRLVLTLLIENLEMQRVMTDTQRV